MNDVANNVYTVSVCENGLQNSYYISIYNFSATPPAYVTTI